MKLARFASLAVVACSIAAAGCSNSASTPFHGIACPQIAQEGPPIVEPSPGASGVPTAAGTLAFHNSLQPANVAVSLVPSTNGTPVPLGIVHGGATPNPNTGYPLVTLQYPQLASATKYAVTYTDQAQPCPLGISSGGSFTTQ